MIENQMFALDMDSRTSQMKQMHLQESLVPLLNALWDQVCAGTTYRKTVEFTFDHEGMEFTIAELRVPAFYFFNEKKFWRQMKSVLKLDDSEYWMSRMLFNKHFCLTGAWNRSPLGVSRTMSTLDTSQETDRKKKL